MQAGDLQGQGHWDYSFCMKPNAWHFVNVSISFGSQASKYRQLGMKMNLELKKKEHFTLGGFSGHLIAGAAREDGDGDRESEG